MSDKQGSDTQLEGLRWIVGGLASVVFAAWLIPTCVVLLHTGTLAGPSPIEAVSALGRLAGDGGFGDPAAAYPPEVARSMPTAAGWWAAVAGVVATLSFVGAAFLKHVEPTVARERVGRRSFDWRGARPRPWARPRDLRLGAREAEGFTIGRLDGRTVATEEQAHVVVIAPTRAGKTTRCVIPWLLEHDGPAIVTSTKRDVLEATREARGKTGHVWIYDPFGPETMGWSPLDGCRSWSQALRQAQWLADASSDGDSEIARYWRGEAAKLLAPMIHAAALDDEGTMIDVLHWIDEQKLTDVGEALVVADAVDAARQLASIKRLDTRNRGTTFMSASSVLAAYRYPEVESSLHSNFTPKRLLASAGDTLYLVSSERHQRLLAPLLVALVSSILHEAAESGVLLERDVRLRILLDEAANIVPLPELPRMLSQAAGHGIRFATIWQSLAQITNSHGRAADTILANSTAKLVMGPVTDEATRSFVLGHVGADRPRRDEGDPLLTASGLQQLTRGRALLFSGAALPAVVELG